jgi:hypothetical protein
MKDKNSFYENIDIHMRISTWLFIGAVALIIVSIFIIIALLKEPNPYISKLPVIVMVMLAGIAGGFVSSLNRVQQYKSLFPKEEYEHFKKISTKRMIIFSLIPSVIGAISAVVLYGVFAGEMLSGTLFPEFGYISQSISSDNHSIHRNFIDSVTDWHPKEASDYIKSIVWGFIAGFSERFVPNILENFSKKQKE